MFLLVLGQVSSKVAAKSYMEIVDNSYLGSSDEVSFHCYPHYFIYLSSHLVKQVSDSIRFTGTWMQFYLVLHLHGLLIFAALTVFVLCRTSTKM